MAEAEYRGYAIPIPTPAMNQPPIRATSAAVPPMMVCVSKAMASHRSASAGLNPVSDHARRPAPTAMVPATMP